MNTPENNKRTRLDNWAIGLLGVAVVVLGLMYLGQPSATRIGDMTVASRDGWRRNRSSATCLDVLINVNRAVPDGTQIGKIEEIFALIASGR